MKKKPKPSFQDMLELMAYMRSPKGCPWDREQTVKSMKKCILDEAKEVADAIDAGKDDEITEELGDLFWNVIFISQIAKEEGRFDISDVMDGVHNKIVSRHPHVFGEEVAKTPEEVLKLWGKQKEKEKKAKTNKKQAGR
ncbi:MazG nucleotide pyrophosphohydrolase domain protein [uncultured archaeon]|nr:MazG nucleotide pyrophosphohydrolase domain protein [uncultured archaeon]